MKFFKRKIKILLLIGVSGSGKTYIERMLNNYKHPKIEFNKLKQYTTRPPRSKEELELKVYEFITDDEYEFMKNSLLAKTEVNGFKYGTDNKFKRSTFRKTVVNTIIVNRLGYDNIKEFIKNKKNIDCLTVEIYSNDFLEKREDRDIDIEKKEIEGLSDIRIDNSRKNRKTAEDIIAILKETSFI